MATSKSRAFLLVALLCLPEFARAHFEALTVESRTPIETRLARVDARKDQPPIQYQGYKYLSKRVQGSAPIATFDVEFSELTAGQFDFLQDTYGMGRFRLRFDPKRTYTLRDFLPPVLQAVANSIYIPEYESAQPNRLFLSNCWNLAIAFLVHSAMGPAQGKAGFPVFYVPEGDFRMFLNNNPYLELIPGNEKRSITNPNAQPGDLIVYRFWVPEKGYVDHVSLFIDTDVYFEKVGPNAPQPYRFTTFPAFEMTGRFDFQYYRLKPGTRMPHPKALFQTMVSWNASDKKKVFAKANGLSFIDYPIRYRFDLGAYRLSPRAGRPTSENLLIDQPMP